MQAQFIHLEFTVSIPDRRVSPGIAADGKGR